MNPTQLAENTHDVDHARPATAAAHRSRALRLVAVPLMAVLLSIGAASAASADTGAERDAGYETNLGALVGLGI
ncbi:hypothetical protein ACJ6WD_34015 [Streptomyces sp. VTCC 41912]|uniref:hypothetical protein n=1 Tax=Streptomyces sp. VTCC 41912 TaxID=3383243 RepID=UPI003896C265